MERKTETLTEIASELNPCMNEGRRRLDAYLWKASVCSGIANYEYYKLINSSKKQET